MLLDSEGRAVLTEHCLAEPAVPGLEDEAEGGVRKNRLVVVNVYCPMYDPARDKEGDTLSRLQYKINFYRLLETRCSALERAGKYVYVTALCYVTAKVPFNPHPYRGCHGVKLFIHTLTDRLTDRQTDRQTKNPPARG